MRGYVYLMGDLRGSDAIKIGYSKHPEKRVRQVKDAWLMHVIQVSDMRKAETLLHGILDEGRWHGEWFSLSDDTVMLLRTITMITENYIFVRYPDWMKYATIMWGRETAKHVWENSMFTGHWSGRPF